MHQMIYNDNFVTDATVTRHPRNVVISRAGRERKNGRLLETRIGSVRVRYFDHQKNVIAVSKNTLYF